MNGTDRKPRTADERCAWVLLPRTAEFVTARAAIWPLRKPTRPQAC